MKTSSIFILFTAALTATAFATSPLRKGSVCTHRPNDCPSDLACDGRGSTKRCIAYKQPGMECRVNEPFWICQPGLSCEDSTCRIPLGAICTDNRDDCVDGTSCDGRGSTKRCLVYKQPGMECRADEDFWVCQPGLSCEDSTCRIPLGAICTDNRDDCVDGTSCDGRGSTKRCLVYKQPGMECRTDEDFWVCQPGLTCQDSACKIPIGGSCSSAPTQCADDATCQGSGRNRVCTPKPRELGEECNRSFKCAAGLECDGLCKLPKKANCLRNPTQCIAGTVCSGTRLKKLCSPERSEGHRCSEVGFLPCGPGLSCVNNVCARGSVPRGARCQGSHEVCKSGLICGGPSHNRICVKPMQKGQFCKGDPYWKCAQGLRCLDKYCVEY